MRGGRSWAWIGTAAGIAAMAVLIAGTVSGVIPVGPDDGPLTAMVYGLLQLSFAVSGSLVVVRAPGNLVGWMLWSAGLLVALGLSASLLPGWAFTTWGPSPAWTALALLAEPSIQVAFSLIVGFLLLYFPTGRLPSARWRPAAALLFALVVVNAGAPALLPGPLSATYPVPNPIGIDALANAADAVGLLQGVLILVALPLCAMSQVARFRGGEAVVRQQVKWFAAAASLSVALIALAIVAPTQELANGFWGLAMLSLPLLPVSIGVAILRYRLFEIDRLISRTVGWSIVTAMLVLVFAAIILVLQAPLAGITQGGTLSVAVSTLIAAALFQPLRRRVQAAVDRRFNRGRVDAQQALGVFGNRLRDEVDLATISRHLVDAAASTVEPRVVGLWTRSERVDA